MRKHTQGPWQVDDCDKGIWVETPDEVAVCRILRNGNWTLDQARQHARLIAAAPDLLEALTYIEGLAMADDVRDLTTIAATARAAIAKATGEK